MPQTEFKALWDEITARNAEVDGPTAQQLIESFKHTFAQNECIYFKDLDQFRVFKMPKEVSLDRIDLLRFSKSIPDEYAHVAVEITIDNERRNATVIFSKNPL